MQVKLPPIHSYDQFIEVIKSGQKLPSDFYYDCMLRFAEDILFDIAISNQGKVAVKLNMAQPRLSAIASVLKAHIRYLQNNDHDSIPTHDTHNPLPSHVHDITATHDTTDTNDTHVTK